MIKLNIVKIFFFQKKISKILKIKRINSNEITKQTNLTFSVILILCFMLGLQIPLANLFAVQDKNIDYLFMFSIPFAILITSIINFIGKNQKKLLFLSNCLLLNIILINFIYLIIFEVTKLSSNDTATCFNKVYFYSAITIIVLIVTAFILLLYIRYLSIKEEKKVTVTSVINP